MTYTQDLQQRIQRDTLLLQMCDSPSRAAIIEGRLQGLRESLRTYDNHKRARGAGHASNPKT